MKQIMRKTLSLVLAVIMLLSSLTVALAAETNQMSETDAGTVTLSATNATISQNEALQIVNIKLLADKNIQIAGLTVNYAVSDTSGNATLENGVPGNGLGGSITNQSMNVSNGSGAYMTYDSTDDGYVLCEVPVTIAANATGTYTVTFSGIEISDADNGDGYTLASSTVTSTITVSAPTVEGYTAQITAPSAVTVNSIVDVNIGVGHDSDDNFHAAEIVLEYDADILELVEDSLGGKFYTNANGVLKFEDFNSEHSFGTSVYTVQFTALAVCDETVVTLSSAKFLNKAVANSSDLIPAASINPNTAAIAVNEVTYNVTLAEGSNAEGLTYATEVTKGEDLTITAANTNLYVYSISAKINDQTVAVTDNQDGTYTIAAANITGDIELTTSRSGKVFGVEWTGSGEDDVTQPEGAPTYGTDYVFTVPSRVDATAEQAGVTYSATVSIDGSDYSVSAGAGETVTIPGAKIIGDVTIDVTKTVLPANGKTVSISGEDVKFSDNTTEKVVSPGTELTLVLTPESGYTYVVKVDGQAVELTNNQYTLTVGNTDVDIVVTKTLITENLVTVDDYLTLNSQAGEKLWLVTFNPTLASGKIPTYDGAAMFWSTEYNAYCYLVKAVSLDVAAASSKLGVTTATAENVDYSGNVNKTNLTDAADAQFVANMYNAMYSGIDNNVTMPMFLSADMDGNKLVNIDDANTIIQEKVLNIAAN